ncbi:multidrug resistance-associated protein 1 isoform X1 [Agrilus planipennis]|uniref:ABC-type glutathione-S-conjugate transporter n=1 Tax=Agrilus planipennis TaxID=224129 RepID=A0A1W4XSV3_AGRPL|nr:multidrug resistance-associated protein 1 isoform X1 [Agrilus planipennis]
MENFCGSEFWNLSLTWNTDDPDFTKCFEQTVLIWVPCLFLWIFTSLEVFYIANSKNQDIPWSIINILKLLTTGALIVLTITDLITTISNSGEENPIYNVDISTPVIKLLSFILSAILVYYNKKHGLRASGLLFLFWFFLLLCGIPQFRTEIREFKSEHSDTNYVNISYLIYFCLVIIMFLLNCFADKEPRKTKYPKSQNPCPEDGSSFLSRLTFNWFHALALKGYRHPLEVSDLWDMKHEDGAQEVVPIFDKYWQKSLQKIEGLHHTRASFKGDSASVNFIDVSKKKKKASVLPALVKAFGPTFLFGALLKLFQDILTFASPQILKLLIDFVKNKESQWKGYLYVILLFATATIQTLILSQYFNRMFIVGMRIRTALISAIYRKALRMSNTSKKETTVGEIVNLMSVDAQKFIDLTAYLNMLWSAPLQIVLALYFLWDILGPSVLAGLAVMVVLIPVNGFIANKAKVLQIKQMKNKDERVKLMNEVLSGIKVLKLYAWEPSFEEQVLKIRGKEINVLKKAAYLNAGTSFIWSCAPFLVSLVSFVTFVMVDENNVFDAETAFVSLSLFNILRFPLSMLPMMISNMVQTWVSVKRINKFMNAEELDPNNVQHDPSETSPIVIENGSFDWGEDPILSDINLRIDKKELIAVVGTVGSGKSSLISAIVGEMNKIKGRVNTIGQIAYVPQQAWIQNATLRDNILFGKEYNEKYYDSVVEACALKPDFSMLPAGDQTEIGEKGINLSGGQKQRVSLARAVYARAEIYLLDDPLSAVDSHVGKHIFEKVIGPQGLLKDKTRILVTHSITYLPEVDRIVVIKDGRVSETGTYRELLDSKEAFAEFLNQHMAEVSDEEVEEDVDELKKLSTGAPVESLRKLSRHSSRTESTPDRANGSLTRQRSVDSSVEKSIRNRSQSNESIIRSKQDLVGEKLIEVEKAETGSVKWAVYKHYLKSIGVLLTVATIVLNIIYQFFNIGSNFWLSIWSNDNSTNINGTVDATKRDTYLGVYGALGIGQAISIFLSSLALFVGSLNGAFVLHNYLLYSVIRSSCNMFYDVTPVGRILNRFSKDVDVLDSVLPMTIRAWLNCFLGVLATILVISITTPIFISVIVPIGIFYYFIQRFYVATSRQLKRLESVSRSPIYSHFGETVAGIPCIRAYGEQERFIKESEAKVDLNQVCYFPSIISNRWLAVRLEMVGNLIILFAALFAVQGNQNAGLVGLSISYALQITQTLNWLVRMTSDVETNIVAVERIKEYGETPQEAPWEIPNKTPPKSWPDQGAVSFNNYSLRYRPGLELVLKRITFSVKGGEKVGIVGRTGAGKSSLTLALFRIVEAAEGEITIDGIRIAELGLHDLRSRLTIIPQDAVLFSGSLRMNLDPFNKHSDEDVWRALEFAHLKSFVKGLPAGLNHEVTEGGENLSVGQRQLICLSRALLRKTKVLVLDEATAAVDLETDDLIQQTIRTEFKDCTVLTIAHRLNTIMDSDRVIVLDKGCVMEFDTPKNLMYNKQSIFYGMAKDAGLEKYQFPET